MVKKALLCGLNYPNHPGKTLYGGVNDALNWSKLLETTYKFDEVRVLIDQFPDGTLARDLTQIPTKQNILGQLGWLVDSEPGDVLVFVFAGHGTQAMDTTVATGDPDFGCVDEGLVPADFEEMDLLGNAKMVTDDELHGLFAAVPTGCLLTVVCDCCHAGNLLDVPCTLDCSGELVASRKRPREVNGRDESVWKKNPHAYARARFLPPFHRRAPPIREKATGVGAHLGKMSLNPGVTAFSFASCRSEQTALDANIKGQHQGLMSFCLLEALHALRHRCTYDQLLKKASQIAQDIREKYMPSMDQQIQLAFNPNAKPTEAVLFDELYAPAAQHSINLREPNLGQRAEQPAPEPQRPQQHEFGKAQSASRESGSRHEDRGEELRPPEPEWRPPHDGNKPYPNGGYQQHPAQNGYSGHGEHTNNDGTLHGFHGFPGEKAGGAVVAEKQQRAQELGGGCGAGSMNASPYMPAMPNNFFSAAPNFIGGLLAQAQSQPPPNFGGCFGAGIAVPGGRRPTQ